MVCYFEKHQLFTGLKLSMIMAYWTQSSRPHGNLIQHVKLYQHPVPSPSHLPHLRPHQPLPETKSDHLGSFRCGAPTSWCSSASELLASAGAPRRTSQCSDMDETLASALLPLLCDAASTYILAMDQATEAGCYVDIVRVGGVALSCVVFLPSATLLPLPRANWACREKPSLTVATVAHCSSTIQLQYTLQQRALAELCTPSVPKYLSFQAFQMTITYGCMQTYFRVQIHSFYSVCSHLLKCLERQVFRNGGSSSNRENVRRYSHLRLPLKQHHLQTSLPTREQAKK